MPAAFRSAAPVALALVLRVVQWMLGTLFALHPFTPNLIVPIVIFLGVSPDVHLVRGAVVAFLVGYLLDVFGGNRMGLETFVCVATFLLSRSAGLRLFMRNPGLQMALVFVVAILAGGTVLALRAIFSRPAPFPAGTALDTALAIGAPALATAVCAPLVFAAVQRIHSTAGQRREESTA